MSYLANLKRAVFATSICLLAVVVWPVVAQSQESLARLAERQRQIVSEIERIEADYGAHARELIEPLTALSLLYDEAGDYRFADPTIERLLQVIRANYGLYSLEQVPSIRQLLAHELERGNAASAWDLEQSLLRLAERNLDDVRTARILRDTADRRMRLLERYNAGEFPPEIVLGCYYREIVPFGNVVGDGLPMNTHGIVEESCTSGSRRQAQQRLLGEAQNFYAQAINILIDNEDYSSEDLPTLLMDLADSSYRYSNPVLGSRSLHYLLAYQATVSAPLLDRVETLLHIADWDLLYANSSNGGDAALAQYEEIVRLLEGTPTARTAIGRSFMSEVPVRLPAFYPNPLVTTEEGSFGYIDVAFVVDAHGRGRKVRILETENAPASAERRLEQFIERSRFRPQLVDGRFQATGTIVVRYHLKP